MARSEAPVMRDTKGSAGRGRRTARGAPAQFVQRRFVGGMLKHSPRPRGGVILIAPYQQCTHCWPQRCALVAESVLAAPDPEARNRLIVAHLDRLEGDLARTRATVLELRGLLERPVTPRAVARGSMGLLIAPCPVGDAGRRTAPPCLWRRPGRA